MDQRELLNKIINHKMLLKMVEAEQGINLCDPHVFSRRQMQSILNCRGQTESALLLAAIRAQIASEEEMFRCVEQS